MYLRRLLLDLRVVVQFAHRHEEVVSDISPRQMVARLAAPGYVEVYFSVIITGTFDGLCHFLPDLAYVDIDYLYFT